MSLCGRKALTLLSSVFAVCALGLLGIAVSTDYWLYLEEGIILPVNQTTDIRMSLHSGLWRVCFLAGKQKGRYIPLPNSELVISLDLLGDTPTSLLWAAVEEAWADGPRVELQIISKAHLRFIDWLLFHSFSP